MEDERGGAVPDRATFARTLGTLKQEGSNILLVGTETTSAHQTACRRLLGGTGQEPRYRLFVTDEKNATGSGCDGGAEAERVKTVEYTSEPLEAKLDAESGENQPSLGALGIEIVETVDEFADEADGFDPSELRVCVDSLVPLLQEYDSEAVFRLLHVTTSRVSHARGMGHYHLPLEPDHDAVNLLEPMFDAIVTVRSRSGTDEHQWYLREADTTTDWLEL